MDIIDDWLHRPNATMLWYLKADFSLHSLRVFRDRSITTILNLSCQLKAMHVYSMLTILCKSHHRVPNCNLFYMKLPNSCQRYELIVVSTLQSSRTPNQNAQCTRYTGFDTNIKMVWPITPVNNLLWRHWDKPTTNRIGCSSYTRIIICCIYYYLAAYCVYIYIECPSSPNSTEFWIIISMNNRILQ